uniref:Uncharacterized protein n=1 Tax=Rhizophora mucronata TaxID=61149 RepID=A0A2P2PTQ7_RHIMU
MYLIMVLFVSILNLNTHSYQQLLNCPLSCLRLQFSSQFGCNVKDCPNSSMITLDLLAKKLSRCQRAHT